MFDWLAPLDPPILITLILVVGIVAVILAYFGGVKFDMGKTFISFGRKSTKRSCGDCILLIINKRERYESQLNFISNRILKNQMNVAEQKLIEIQRIFLSDYRALLLANRTSETTSSEENKQYRLYQGLLGNALFSVKDEIRRSFKENGFDVLSGVEFSAYVKNKAVSLVSIGHDYMLNLYPYDGMIVSTEARLKKLEARKGLIEDICFDLFVRAKEIKKDADDKIAALNKEFAAEMDSMTIV